MVIPDRDAPGTSPNQLRRHGGLDWVQGSSCELGASWGAVDVLGG